MAIQLAYHMGFSEVYLIGKDHSYSTKESAGSGIISSGEESNHFVSGYYRKGQNWDAPDYVGEERAYHLALRHFTKNGRFIYDATVNGNLEVFPKVEFNSLFKNERRK